MTEPIRQTREMGQTGRKKGERTPSAGPSFPSSPFLRSTHAAARPIEAERSRENEINCLAQSTALSCSLCPSTLVARVERASDSLFGTKVTDSQRNFSGFWAPRARELAVVAFEQSPIYTTATTASDSAQFSGFYAPEPSKEPPAVVAAPSASERASDEKVLMYVSGKSPLPSSLSPSPSLLTMVAACSWGNPMDLTARVRQKSGGKVLFFPPATKTALPPLSSLPPLPFPAAAPAPVAAAPSSPTLSSTLQCRAG